MISKSPPWFHSRWHKVNVRGSSHLIIMSTSTMVARLLMALFALEGGAAVSAFLGGHYGTHSVRRRVRPLPLTTTNPSARASRRSEIMTMYKSKSDKDEYDSGKSESRSWFKPWRWFARRERRKRQPKLSPTIESLLTCINIIYN